MRNLVVHIFAAGVVPFSEGSGIAHILKVADCHDELIIQLRGGIFNRVAVGVVGKTHVKFQLITAIRKVYRWCDQPAFARSTVDVDLGGVVAGRSIQPFVSVPLSRGAVYIGIQSAELGPIFYRPIGSNSTKILDPGESGDDGIVAGAGQRQFQRAGIGRNADAAGMFTNHRR